MKAGANNTQTLDQRLAHFLLSYRTTAHATTGESLSQLFMGRQLHTRLDRISLQSLGCSEGKP